MSRSTFLAAWVFLLATLLTLSGLATFWWSEDLMVWLIWLVGEEYALGAENVIHNEDGSKLLTNPGAMIAWTIPFWILATVQVGAAATLIWLWVSRARVLNRLR